jgi:hypothetical protein
MMFVVESVCLRVLSKAVQTTTAAEQAQQQQNVIHPKSTIPAGAYIHVGSLIVQNSDCFCVFSQSLRNRKKLLRI